MEYESLACIRLFLESGSGDVSPAGSDRQLIEDATHPEIIRMLVEHGADPARLKDDPLLAYIGLETAEDLPVSAEEFYEARTRHFGATNPEPMNHPFWAAMVRCGWDAYQASSKFNDQTYDRTRPVWCHRRFGMSLTILPDGRSVQIAGEHEDSYDPDFCIYNDVVVHDGKGRFEIFGYPEDVFPPTDFHSATLMGEWIYIIGNLGYHTSRGTQTPVYRLHTGTWKIERVETTGESPGWIHSHMAQWDGERIFISGGKVQRIGSKGTPELVDNTARHAFDPHTGGWRDLSDTIVETP